MTKTFTQIRLAALLSIALAVAGMAACDSSSTLVPRRHLRAASLSRDEGIYYDDYAPGDSSPKACAMLNCESLTPDEKQAFEDLAGYARQQAANNEDYECWLLWGNAWSMVNTDFVFNMKSDIIFDNGSVNGAYNFDHGEAYLRMSNFPSEASALNTLAHETAHSMGYHDPGYTTSNWYAQDEADMCSIYAGG